MSPTTRGVNRAPFAASRGTSPPLPVPPARRRWLWPPPPGGWCSVLSLAFRVGGSCWPPAGVPFLTLLMVVLIQHTQNHDDRATQLKLDELIRATRHATNRMMTVEDASRADLDRIHDNFQSQAESAAPEP